jgi:hypothetical protein
MVEETYATDSFAAFDSSGQNLKKVNKKVRWRNVNNPVLEVKTMWLESTTGSMLTW